MSRLKTDKIAILMACYNGGIYISEQIDSILNQTASNWELFIHDDGSKDDTVEIINRYSLNYPDKIHIIDGKSSGGAKSNFFYLINSVDAPYVMFCDQDDVWKEDKVEKTFAAMKLLETETGKMSYVSGTDKKSEVPGMEAIKTASEIGTDKKSEVSGYEKEDMPLLVFSDLEVVDENLNTIAPSMCIYQKLNPERLLFKNLMIHNVVTGCTTMINRSLLDMLRKPCNKDNLIMHDWWAALIAAEYGKIKYLPEATIKYRQHGDNSVGAKDVTNLSYIAAKAGNSKGIKESLNDTRKQTKEFADTFETEEPVIREYGRLGEEPKLKRLAFYFKNHVWKYGFARNMGLIIFG